MFRRWWLPFLLGLLFEIFVFNLKSIESRFFPPASEFSVSVNGAAQVDAVNHEYLVTNERAVYFELKNINTKVRNVYLRMGSKNNSSKIIQYQIFVTDSANGNYLRLPQREYLSTLTETHYIRLHTVGVTPKLRINILNFEQNESFQLHSVELNATRPFLFRWYRYIIITVLCILWMLFRPASSLYQQKLNVDVASQKFIIVFVIIIHLFYIGGLGYISSNRDWKKTGWLADLQYNYLVDSLLDGRLDLGIEPPESLKYVSNPYDPGLRNDVLRRNKESCVIDFAYYEGKYYCYFGVVPVLLFYLPYQLLTGRWLSSSKLIVGCALTFVIACFCFVYQVIRRYCNSISLGVYLLLSSCLVAAGGIVYCVHMPTIYSVPFVTGILFCLLGARYWLKAANADYRVDDNKSLFIGSLCFALVMGCRPQMAIALFWALPIFYNQLKHGYFFTRRGVYSAALALSPFVLIGTIIALYNYMRFGSIFDFGATYNLTGLDMTHRGVILERLKLGLFEFFFQPLCLLPKFPYLQTVAGMMNMATDYQGLLINEPMLGGVFVINPIMFYLFQIRKYKIRLIEMRTFSLCITSLLFAGIVAIVDIQMVGLTLRYLSDFSMFMMVAAILVLFAKYDSDDGNLVIANATPLLLLAIATIAINYYSPLAAGRFNDLRYGAPRFWMLIKYVFFASLL